jgi:rod shape-determining protein MreD
VLLIVIYMYLIFLVQTTLLIKAISVFGIEPDLVIIALTYYSLTLNPTRSITLGFFTGFVLDSFQPSLMGINMLIYTLYTFVFSFLRNQLNKLNPSTQFLAVAIGCVSSDTVYFFLTEYTHPQRVFIELFRTFLPEAIFTGLLAVFFYFLLPNLKRILIRILQNDAL